MFKCILITFCKNKNQNDTSVLLGLLHVHSMYLPCLPTSSLSASLRQARAAWVHHNNVSLLPLLVYITTYEWALECVCVCFAVANMFHVHSAVLACLSMHKSFGAITFYQLCCVFFRFTFRNIISSIGWGHTQQKKGCLLPWSFAIRLRWSVMNSQLNTFGGANWKLKKKWVYIENITPGMLGVW